jgi:tRNA(fMet)-specific endonuclease VapC
VTHLLDTNFCVSYLRKGGSSTAAAKLAAAPVGSVALCSIVVAELHYGARRSAHVSRSLSQVRTFCTQFASLSFDDGCAEQYGHIRSHLESIGTPIGPNDLMIASIALANGLTLVTNNTVEFQRVPGLSLEDWQTP